MSSLSLLMRPSQRAENPCLQKGVNPIRIGKKLRLAWLASGHRTSLAAPRLRSGVRAAKPLIFLVAARQSYELFAVFFDCSVMRKPVVASEWRVSSTASFPDRRLPCRLRQEEDFSSTFQYRGTGWTADSNGIFNSLRRSLARVVCLQKTGGTNKEVWNRGRRLPGYSAARKAPNNYCRRTAEVRHIRTACRTSPMFGPDSSYPACDTPTLR